MPRLPTYTAKVEPGAISGGRRASAEDIAGGDLVALGRGMQVAGASALQAKEEDESRKVLVQQAEIRAKYAKRLDEATTSGEDVTKIREELDNDLSKVSEGLQTKKGLESAALHAANTGAVFDNQANNIKVERARLEARVAGSQFLNSTGAIITSNPSYLPQAEKDVDAFAATLVKLSPQQRDVIANDLKQNLNVAAAMRNAQIDPDGTIAAVKGGQFNMTAEQRLQVVNEAEREKRAQRAEKAYLDQEARRQESERVDEARGQMLDGIIKGRVRWADIRDNPAFAGPQGANAKKELYMFMEARAREGEAGTRRSDPKVFNNLYLAATAPEGDPRRIYNTDAVFAAVEKGQINTNDAERLRSIIGNQKDENNRGFGQRMGARMQVVQNAMRSSPVYQAQPDLAAAVQVEMITQVEQKAQELRKANKSPESLLDPDSKDYYFTPNRLKQVEQDVRRRTTGLAIDAAAASEVTFPDGVTRKWSGKGDKTDIKTWVPVTQAAK